MLDFSRVFCTKLVWRMIPLFRFATEFINIVPVYFETCFDTGTVHTTYSGYPYS